ncbi:MAG: preprotein translocase subunit SecE [Candidatus Paceibacterota bacterium]
MSKATEYIKETRAEMKHVNWPTRKQATIFTVIVIVLSILVAMFLGFFDYVFSYILKAFILKA